MLQKATEFLSASQRSLLSGFVLLFAFLVCLTPAYAKGLNQLITSQSNQQQFLPVEEAFQVEGRIANGQAVIQFTVTPGHYLYKKRFRFTPVDDSTTLGDPVFPVGKETFDENLGEVLEVFDHSIDIEFPISSTRAMPELQVRFQGCAEAGLCYPPHTVTVPLVVTDTSLQQNPISAPPGSANIEAPSESSSFDKGLLTSLLLFLLTGIGLTFTPCVLPMVPILSSILVGSSQVSKSRILALTTAYILGMSLTFALAGTLMGLFGASLNLQAKLQSPWLIIPFALLFVLLSLCMFGLYELQLPEKLRNKLGNASQPRGSLSGAILMGLLSALVVSPCVSAPLAGALIYISTTGDVLRGGLSLLAMGLGMGVPLMLIGLGGRQLLPKAGAWMDSVKTFFGFLLLAVAIWMLERVIPGPLTLLLWGALLIGAAVRLKAFSRMTGEGWQVISQTLGILLLVYGICLVIGAARGSVDPLRPLAGLGHPEKGADLQALAFNKTDSINDLNQLLQAATNKQKTVMIDVYADWCLPCKVMERSVFPSPLVRDQLAGKTLVKLDITRNTRGQQQWLSEHQLFGPPALLFLDSSGKEVHRIIGEVSIRELAEAISKHNL